MGHGITSHASLPRLDTPGRVPYAASARAWSNAFSGGRTMANAVKGVIAGAKGAPVSVETILVPDPGPGEALVRIQACGVCHTDLHYREGAITNDFPFLLGHEAAGIVDKSVQKGS